MFALLKMFRGRGWSIGELTTLIRKLTTVAALTEDRILIDHAFTCTYAKLDEVEDLVLIFYHYLLPVKTSSSIKRQLKHAFSCIILVTRN